MPNLNWIKDNTALFEGLPPTPTKEQSKVNEGLSFGQFVKVRVSRINCNWIWLSRQYAQYFLEPYLKKTYSNQNILIPAICCKASSDWFFLTQFSLYFFELLSGYEFFKNVLPLYPRYIYTGQNEVLFVYTFACTQSSKKKNFEF